jgi:hypothetical protein
LLLGFDAASTRNHTARAEFGRMNPCPSTGKTGGTCPGYVVDHFKSLCAGGADVACNMQWQSKADAKVKDRDEQRQWRKHNLPPIATEAVVDEGEKLLDLVPFRNIKDLKYWLI